MATLIIAAVLAVYVIEAIVVHCAECRYRESGKVPIWVKYP